MIIHIDMDAFYASIEERDHPQWRGKPLIVGGTADSRGVVSTANYAARRFGIHSAMPTATALKRCPNVIQLPVRMDYYAEISRQIFAICARFTPQIEPLSLDEAFLDARQSEKIFGASVEIARYIKATIFSELHLIASVGVAPNKFVAKIASDIQKPDGFVVIQENQLDAFLDPLPVSRLWGVGKAGQRFLQQRHIHSIADVKRLSPSMLQEYFGGLGNTIWHLARGIDPRPVETDREAKSISNETTFARDTADPAFIQTVLLRLTEQVAYRLRAADLRARTVQLKARYPDFKTVTRSHTLRQGTQDTQTLWQTVKHLYLEKLEKHKLLRLLGVGVSQLQQTCQCTGDLFDNGKQKQIDKTADAIRKRFGEFALYRAGLQKPDN